jgi:hypothetical protein
MEAGSLENDVEKLLERLEIQRERVLSSAQEMLDNPPNKPAIDPLHDADFYFVLLRRLYRIVQSEAKANSRVANLKGKYQDLYDKVKMRDHTEHPPGWEKLQDDFPSLHPGSAIKVVWSIIVNKDGVFITSGDQRWDFDKDHKRFLELFKKFLELQP